MSALRRVTSCHASTSGTAYPRGHFGQRRTGFTLIELCIVIAVAAIILAVGIGGNSATKSSGKDRLAIASIHAAVSNAQAQAKREESHAFTVVIGGSHIAVNRDNVEMIPYSTDLPAGYSLSSTTAQVQSDGTLDASQSLTLTTPEVSYALQLDRSGVVRVQ